MQVWLPGALKANASEGSADVKGFIQVLATWKMGDSCLKAHLNITVQVEVFTRRERGSRTKRPREGVAKFSTCQRAQSTHKAGGGRVSVILAEASWNHCRRSANLELECLKVGSVSFKVSS